jgi:tRNA-specific 2-thiouridylase
MSNPPKYTCLLGMSGGTDSSVAAMLLLEQGYTVIGVTFRFWDDEHAQQHLLDAQQTAQKLGINHIIYDARKEFQSQVVDYFVQEYMAGRTPVPCTRCNTQLKWRILSSLAETYNCDYIATGHYCRMVQRNHHYYITQGLDAEKDQSFFLWGLPQEILSKIIFPLGELTKTQVRQIAASKGFERVANKKDSIGVCFCPHDYRSFLRNSLSNNAFSKGDFVDENGTVLGVHEGYPFYTVGQRRGLGLQLNKAVFVKEIRPEENIVVLAPLKSLYKTSISLRDYKLVNPDDFSSDFDTIVKIRYRKQATPCRIILKDKNELLVELAELLDAIAPGQAAVFYRDGMVLGGGIITN